MLWLVAGFISLFLLASWSRKAKQRAAVRGLRRNFPDLARERLSSAFPGIEGHLPEQELATLFDWILNEMLARTGSSSFGALMAWTIRNPGSVPALTFAVTDEVVQRLPAPALAIIDKEHGRDMAAFHLRQALEEAGQRTRPELNRRYV